MSTQDINSRLHDVFVSTFEDPSFEMAPEARMGDLEVWDSFNHINLMLGIEAEFGVEFDSDEIGTLLTVGQIAEAIERRLHPTGT